MDPLTHTLLGASTCQAFYSHKLSRKSIVLGALAATLPDLDTLAGVFYGSFVGLVAHRGPTHSLWFPFVTGPLLGYLIWRWYGKSNAQNSLSLKHWMGMFSLTILSHPLLDVCTSYGTQLLAPFSNHRFAIDAIAVIDPLYTLILFISVIVGLWACSTHQQKFTLARRTACVALILSTAYIFYGRILNQKAEQLATTALISQDNKAWKVQAYPTLLQLYYRRIVAHSKQTVCVGYVTLWKNSKVTWHCEEQANDPKIDLVRNTPEGQIFEWFSMCMTFAALKHEKDYSLVQIYDLRYGFDRPHESMWSIQAKVSAQNQLLSPVIYQESQFTKVAMWDYLKQMWLNAFYSNSTS